MKKEYKFQSNGSIETAGSEVVKTKSQGTSKVRRNGKTGRDKLDGISYVSKITQNLMCCSDLCENDQAVFSSKNKCVIKIEKIVEGVGKHMNGMYAVEFGKGYEDQALSNTEKEIKIMSKWDARNLQLTVTPSRG